jgi:hypothetical protein
MKPRVQIPDASSSYFANRLARQPWPLDGRRRTMTAPSCGFASRAAAGWLAGWLADVMDGTMTDVGNV